MDRHTVANCLKNDGIQEEGISYIVFLAWEVGNPISLNVNNKGISNSS